MFFGNWVTFFDDFFTEEFFVDATEDLLLSTTFFYFGFFSMVFFCFWIFLDFADTFNTALGACFLWGLTTAKFFAKSLRLRSFYIVSFSPKLSTFESFFFFTYVSSLFTLFYSVFAFDFFFSTSNSSPPYLNANEPITLCFSQNTGISWFSSVK